MAHFGFCDDCNLWTLRPNCNKTLCCSCGQFLPVSSDGEDCWVQCDACDKWRCLSDQHYSSLQALVGEHWECNMLFEGATCRLHDDWKLHNRSHAPLLRPRGCLAAKEKTEEDNIKRAERSEGRALGLTAVQRLIAEHEQHDENSMEYSSDTSSSASEMKRQPRFISKQLVSGGRAPLPDMPVWDECTTCGSLFEVQLQHQNEGKSLCPDCGTEAALPETMEVDSWVQCDDCDKWRNVHQSIASQAQRSCEPWTCARLKAGASCKSTTREWGLYVRKRRAQLRHEAITLCFPETLSERFALPQEGYSPAVIREELHALLPSSLLPEYVPGRDTLLTPSQLVSGLDMVDQLSLEHVFWSTALQRTAFEGISPALLRFLELYKDGKLPISTDGRLSAGPIDMAAFVAQPQVKEAIRLALDRRRARLCRQLVTRDASNEDGEESLGGALPDGASTKEAFITRHVMHVSPDSRKIYIGEECDVTKSGAFVTAFAKSWRSLPIQSWSGGVKVADRAGGQPRHQVKGILSDLLADEEAGLVQAAEIMWDAFAEHPSTAPAASRMLHTVHSNPAKSAMALGRTGWNAYSFNLDFRTGKHVDGKNVIGSYSALAVFETGNPFCGGFYLLPQYRLALDIRQGSVLYHRSGDPGVGVHGNSGLWLPDGSAHRIAVVLYQTQLVDDKLTKQMPL